MLDIGWIVCRDKEREVVDGCVLCPVDGSSDAAYGIRVQDCLDCRHLMATPLDRQPAGMCATET
jgi:hypothetical protein